MKLLICASGISDSATGRDAFDIIARDDDFLVFRIAENQLLVVSLATMPVYAFSSFVFTL